MVAGVELEANAIGHGMTNQQSECQIFPYTTESWNALENWFLPTTPPQLHFFSTAQSLPSTILNHRSWYLSECQVLYSRLRISNGILGSQNALIKVSEAFRL